MVDMCSKRLGRGNPASVAQRGDGHFFSVTMRLAVTTTSPVYLLLRAGQRLELSRILPVFGEILEDPLPFLSFYVSVFRHP